MLQTQDSAMTQTIPHHYAENPPLHYTTLEITQMNSETIKLCNRSVYIARLFRPINSQMISLSLSCSLNGTGDKAPPPLACTLLVSSSVSIIFVALGACTEIATERRCVDECSLQPSRQALLSSTAQAGFLRSAMCTGRSELPR